MRRFLVLAAFALAVVPFGVAHADAIDGHWCSVRGETISIDGPRVHTPGGRQLEGLYDRHGFIYTVPDAEPDAGKQVRMVLVDDNTVRLTIGEGATELQTWRRCRPGTS